MRKTILFLFLFFISFSGKSQKGIDYISLEQQTLQCYYAAQWDSLITIGNIGIKNGHDYFYLRFRMGVAYFNIGKYATAIKHLEKARNFNSQDELTNRYLYLSYKYMGRFADAEVLGKTLSDSLRKVTAFRKTPFFSNLYVESGFSPASSYTPVAPPRNSANTYESSMKNNAMGYGFIGLSNQITPWLSLFYGYTYLNTSATKYTFQKQVDSLKPKLDTAISDISISQYQIYFNPRIRISKGLYLSTYFHKINTKSVMQGDFSQTDTTIAFNDGIGGFSLEEHYRNFVFFGEISNNKLHNVNHLQPQIGITWFPYANLNLYLGGTLGTNLSKPDTIFAQNSPNRKTIYQLQIGGKISGRLWGEANYFGGNYKDSQTGNGFLFYNTPNNYKMMANGTLMLFLNKVRITLKYQYSSLTGTKSLVNNKKNNQQTYSEYSFNQHTITGGLLWNF
jgi:hypothetical protein